MASAIGQDVAWDLSEINEADPYIKRVLVDNKPIRGLPYGQVLEFSSADAIALREDVFWSPFYKRRTVEATAVRHIYKLLGFDENNIFQWRFEHKLVQALVMNHFVPGSVPRTVGLSTYMARHCIKPDVLALENALRPHYVKRSLGYAAASDNAPDRRSCIAEYLAHSDEHPRGIAAERWVVQQRLSVKEEYRVHTVEDKVIDELTFLRHDNRSSAISRGRPNAYVREVISAFPRTLLADSICGWDVAETASGEYHVIEINAGGFHPEFGRGFQCSGFFQRPDVGTSLIARLIRAIEDIYCVTFLPLEGDCPSEVENVYRDIGHWLQLLRLCRAIQRLKQTVDSTPGQQHSTSAQGVVPRVVARLAAMAELVDPTMQARSSSSDTRSDTE